MAYYQLPHVPPASSYRFRTADEVRPARPPDVTPRGRVAAASLAAGAALGVVATLVPVLFVVSLACGLAAFMVGATSRRRQRADGRPPGAKVWPGAVAVALAGMVIGFAAIASTTDGLGCIHRDGTRDGSSCSP